MARYTSFEFSKKLSENGCRLNTQYHYRPKPVLNQATNQFDTEYELEKITYRELQENEIRVYDIIYDICICYAKEFFGEKKIVFEKGSLPYYELAAKDIIAFLQNNIPQEEIEEFIWKNCMFNPDIKWIKGKGEINA